MIKRLIFTLNLTLIMILFLPIHVNAKSFTIDEVNIRSYIYPNGDLYVEELYTYTFEGSFNGTTRTIGDDKFKGVQFFEGYQVEDDATLETITPKNASPLHVELDGYTFKIHQPSINETKKVFYRYRLKEVARKYTDIGEFYWRFFDSMGDDEIKNLRITVHLANEEFLPDNTYGFMHDLTGGTFQLTDTSLSYENELLPGGETFELRLLFPTEYLTEMDFTENKQKLAEILNEENKYKEQLEHRNNWLPKLENISNYISIPLLLFLLFAIIFPNRIVRFLRQPVATREVEAMDSFTLVALFRKINFKLVDIHAALFRLYQTGYVSIEYEDSNLEARKNGYPAKSTFVYIINEAGNHLRESDQFLIDWLFERDKEGNLSFSIDELPFQNYRAHGSNAKEVSQKRKLFKKMFKEWRKLAKKDDEINQLIKPVFIRKILSHILLPAWLIWLNVYLWNVTVDIQLTTKLILGLISLVIPFLVVVGIRERLKTTIIFILAIMFLPDFGFDDQLENFYGMTVTLMFTSAVLPSIYPTFDGIPYFKGVKRWRRFMNKSMLSLPEDAALIERNFQHAIALGLGQTFHLHYANKLHGLNHLRAYPFLIAPSETGNIYSYVHTVYNYSSSFSGSGSSSTSSGGGGSGGGEAGTKPQ